MKKFQKYKNKKTKTEKPKKFQNEVHRRTKK